MAETKLTQEELEQKLVWAEEALAELGAAPLDINRRNRELLAQRTTYRYRNTFYRVDQAAFDDAQYLILSAIENPEYAAIGLMEDVDAIPAASDREEIRRAIRRAVLAEV